jgi:hypothetical protein
VRLTRHRSALLHLVVSLAVIGACVGAALYEWYPAPIFEALGAGGLAAIVLGVGIVIGPLLTWIVLTPGKAAHLVGLDLAVIIALQLAALAYGLYVVTEARPVYLVFVRDRFEITTASEIRRGELPRAPAGMRELSWHGPQLAGAELPLAPEERLNIMLSALAGADLKTYPQYFVPYEAQAALVRERSKPVAALRERHPEKDGEITRAVARSGLDEKQLAYLPLHGRRKDLALLVERSSARIVGYAGVDPW